MKQITHTSDLYRLPKRFFLFSYGANDEVNLAKRLFNDPNEKATRKEIKTMCKHTSPAFLPGYLRSFFGYSDAWGGSVGTLIKIEDRECPLYGTRGTHGILTEITHRDRGDKGAFYVGDMTIGLSNLCKVENIDGGMYVLQKITKTSENVPVYAFVGRVERYKNNTLPSKSYLNAVGKTLRRSFPEAQEIHIPIRLGGNRQVVRKYKYIP